MQLPEAECLYKWTMALHQTEPFVRVPTVLLEDLLRCPLTGTEWRIILWIVRETYGWNRTWTPFTWYRIARELGINRGVAYRAGRSLIQAGHVEEKVMATLPHGSSDAPKQRFPLPGSNVSVAYRHPKRCLRATVFRRAKDSKEKLKTYINSAQANSEKHPAGAARPVPGKYDGLS